MVLFFCDFKKFLDDHIVNGTIMNNCKYGHASKKQTLAKTTYVTDPAQEIIDIAFDDVEFEVDLKGDLDVDRVFFFVGTRRFFNKFENSFGFV